MRVNTTQDKRVKITPPQSKGSGLDFEAARKRELDRQKAAEEAAKAQAMSNTGFPTQEPEPVKTAFQEKILSFTGGDVLAKGLGQALAMPGTKKTLDEIQAGQGDMQQRLIAAIRKNKAEGKDTTRLVNALKQLTGGIADIGSGAEDLYNPNKITPKQVVGDALQLGTTVVGAGELPGVTKSATQAPGVIKGAVQGLKAGAKAGAIYGGVSGIAQGLKNNKDTAGIVESGLGGAVTGGIAGGAIGGVVGGVSGGINKIRTPKQDKIFDAITPKVNELTPSEYERLVAQGKIAPKTATSPAQYILSDNEKQVAVKYKDLFTSQDPVKNTINVVNEIANKDSQVGKYLSENNGIYNKAQLRSALLSKLDDVSDITVDEGRLQKAKETLVNNFVNNLDKNDMKTLWQARKEFDVQIKKAFEGSPTLQNTVKRSFRNAVQDFISEKTDNVTYKGYMKDMTQLFDIRDVLTNKATKEKNYSAITAWVKKNPLKAKAIGWTIGIGALGKIGKSLID